MMTERTRNAPAVSVIIPTVGRSSLAKAVESALSQALPDGWVEVVVVNDTGRALADPLNDLQADPRVTIISTNRRGVAVARNSGAAVARGAYLTFLDDDDWLLQGGLANLSGLLDRAPEADVAYGVTMVIGSDAGGEVELGAVFSSMAGECASQTLAGVFLSLGALVCRATAFWRIGGFDTCLRSSEDTDLVRRLSMRSRFMCTEQPVHIYYRGAAWETKTDYAASVDALRVSREAMLDAGGAFRRITASARSPYWRARNVKAYAASAYWNLMHGRLSRVASRICCLLASAVLSFPACLRREYWRGLADVQVPGSLQRSLDG